jgi:ABC-type amino acid transport substrate-binding protein
MLKKLFSIIACVFLLNACKEKSNEIVVGLSADYPPFAYFENGEIVGFEVDLAKMIAKSIGTEITFKDMPFDSIIGALQSKRIDMSISAISATDDRKKSVDFSDAYHKAKTVIVCADKLQLDDALNGTLGVQMGTTYEVDLKKLQASKPALKIQSLSKVVDLVQNLWAKRIKGIVLGVGEAQALVNKYPDLHMLDLDNNEVEYAIAFPKGSELLNKFNAQMSTLKDSGQFEQLYKKYFSHAV